MPYEVPGETLQEISTFFEKGDSTAFSGVKETHSWGFLALECGGFKESRTERGLSSPQQYWNIPRL